MANLASLLMYFGMFGSIFLLSQFLQIVQGYSPFQAGLRVLPWTIAPIFVAPIAGAMSDRVGGGLLMGVGLALQAIGLAWLGLVVTPDRALRAADHPVHHLGRRHGPVLRAGRQRRPERRPPEEEGQASGANNAIREVGGVFGVAVLASVFRATGSYVPPQAFVDGLQPAMLVGAVFVAVGAVAAFAIPRKVRAGDEAIEPEARGGSPEPVLVLNDR